MVRQSCSRSLAGILWCVIVLVCSAEARVFAAPDQAEPLKGPKATQSEQRATKKPSGLAPSIELSRAVRPWEFLDAVGTRAGIFGYETGRLEAWVYPLKIMRDFTLKFHFNGRIIPAEKLARRVSVRPEACTIYYAGDSFLVRETLFVPVNEPGAVIILEMETRPGEPLEVEAGFQRDFQLMWPAAIGGGYMSWDETLRAFVMGEERRRFFAAVGSPSAADPGEEFLAGDSSTPRSSFKLGRTDKPKDVRMIILAASFESKADLQKTYRHLAGNHQRLREEAAEYYEHYLTQTVNLKLPDAQLQQAYDWSRISVVKGMVNNPFLGTGLVAGYGTSGAGQRPGFGWFFGRDALWTAFALHSVGDFANARAALDFLSRYQRMDGKIPHEISQSASFLPWFEEYPYAYASADATPLFILAMHDYALKSGDLAFIRGKWTPILKAHAFLRSTRDAQGFAQNLGVGHGWVEGGPLLPVRTELYQSALGVAALRALAALARLTGKDELGKSLEQEFDQQKVRLNELFWIPEKQIYAFALDLDGKKVHEASVLATVPMWFGLLDGDKANAMIDHLADEDHAADWGMRILSSRSQKFSPAGYHFGSVWPLFTGWAAVGEYRYHRPFAAYANLRANALLALDGSLGNVTEVLSGGRYLPLATSSPHQIWSSAMVLTPLLGGLMGLETDAITKRVTVSPHTPPHWQQFELQNLLVGNTTFALTYRKTGDEIVLEVRRDGHEEFLFEVSPAISPKTGIVAVELNDRPLPFRLETHATDQHVVARFPIYGGSSTLKIHLRNDFGILVPAILPRPTEASQNLKVVSESWSPSLDEVEFEVSGLSGREYQLEAYGSAQIAGAEGAELSGPDTRPRLLEVKIPAGNPESYKRHKFKIRFAPTTSK